MRKTLSSAIFFLILCFFLIKTAGMHHIWHIPAYLIEDLNTILPSQSYSAMALLNSSSETVFSFSFTTFFITSMSFWSMARSTNP